MRKIATFQKMNKDTLNIGYSDEQALAQALGYADYKPHTLPHNVCGDIADMQVKSIGASVTAHTWNIRKYLANDAAKTFVVITTSEKRGYRNAYAMTKSEYIAFCKVFAYRTYAAKSKGGDRKLRLRRATKQIRVWCENHITPY